MASVIPDESLFKVQIEKIEESSLENSLSDDDSTAPEVYLISDYLLEHYNFMKKVDFSRLENRNFIISIGNNVCQLILNGISIYRTRLNCLEEFQEINPAF